MRYSGIFSILFVLALLISQPALAADKTRALLAIEHARKSVAQLNQQSAGSGLVEQDLSSARSYLQQAEELYQKNLSWIPLKGLNDEAEPEILDLAEMAEQSARTGLSKLGRQNVEQEYIQLEKQVADARDKVSTLEKQTSELAKLKANAGQIEAIKVDQSTFNSLKQENASLKQELEKLKAENKTLTTQLESMKLEKARLSGQLETIHTERKLDELNSAKKLSDTQRAGDFKEKLSSIGAVTDITDNSLVLVIPRSRLIKTTSRGHQLAPNADSQTKDLMNIMGQYPEYQFSIQVFGYGKPPKLENQKAADQMANILRDFFALKLGAKADRIPSTGAVGASSLFSTATQEPHRRIELKFTRKP